MSKYRKLRASPERYFGDSKSPWLRAVGRRVVPLLMQREGVLQLLEDPSAALESSHFETVATLARGRAGVLAGQRRRALDRAGNPTVSVVMAALDAEEHIEASIRSLLDQSYRVHEVIVVDDGSGDGTQDVVVRMQSRDPRVRLICHERNRGAAAARNRGLSASTGAYLTFQDADDVSHPQRIERQLAALVESPARVCVCNSRRVMADGRRVVVNGKRFAKSFISMLFAREVFERIGYLRQLRVGEDSEYFLRAEAAYGSRGVLHLFETLYFAGFRPNSLLFSNSRTEVRDVAVSHEVEPALQHALDAALARLGAVRRGEDSPYVAMVATPSAASVHDEPELPARSPDADSGEAGDGAKPPPER